MRLIIFTSVVIVNTGNIYTYKQGSSIIIRLMFSWWIFQCWKCLRFVHRSMST